MNDDNEEEEEEVVYAPGRRFRVIKENHTHVRQFDVRGFERTMNIKIPLDDVDTLKWL